MYDFLSNASVHFCNSSTSANTSSKVTEFITRATVINNFTWYLFAYKLILSFNKSARWEKYTHVCACVHTCVQVCECVLCVNSELRNARLSQLIGKWDLEMFITRSNTIKSLTNIVRGPYNKFQTIRSYLELAAYVSRRSRCNRGLFSLQPPKITDVFLNPKRVILYVHTVKMAPLYCLFTYICFLLGEKDNYDFRNV